MTGLAPTRDGLHFGVDVSVFQKVIDWPKVAAAGAEFAIVRADCGASYKDPNFAANTLGARRACLSVGAYHYARPAPGADDARREVDHFWALLEPLYNSGDIAPALDIEESSIEGSALLDWLAEFVDLMREKSGRNCLVYTNPSYLLGKKVVLDTRFADCPLWIAHWGVETPGTLRPWLAGQWAIWQFGATWIDGITTEVDANWARSLPVRGEPIPAPTSPLSEASEIYVRDLAWPIKSGENASHGAV